MDMKYKNIIFDFGNVLGTFDPQWILQHFCDNEEDVSLLSDAIFTNWQALDEGRIDYRQYIGEALGKLPERLHPQADKAFAEWYRYCTPVTQTWEFARELMAQHIPVYLLSNAPSFFAEHAPEAYPILREFDGLLFSGPEVCAKPDEKIYRLLFDRFGLKPEECFFIDDNADNIAAAKKLGMDGIVFTGDVDAVRRATDMPVLP